MTTFLGKVLTSKTTALNKWKARVGEAEANRISVKATTNGKAFHYLCEEYLANHLIGKPDDVSEEDYLRFEAAISTLNRIDNVRHIEQGLFSKRLKLAGTVDCIAEFDGILSIIDHKTSKNPKKESWIEGYFLQETGYAMMYFEMTGVFIEQIVTIISVENENECQVFVKQTKPWINPLLDLVKEYYNL